MLAAMKLSMTQEISEITLKENWGFVLGTFKWVYAILSPLGGFVADRVSRRHVISLSLLVWSAVTLMTGFVTTYDQLVWTRALMGISEAFYIPTALALISDYHRGETRSRAVGLHQVGIYAGIILGGFSGYAAESPQIGWRFAFQFCGIVGVLYSVPLFLFLRNPPKSLKEESREKPTLSATFFELAGNVSFILLVLYFTLPAMAGWIVKDWMPEILREQFNLGQGKAGLSAVLYVQIASLIGVVLGGWLADTWMKRNIRGRIFISAIGMSFFLPSLFGVGNASTLAIAIGFLILFGIGWGFFDCNNMPILCQIVRPQFRATGYGMMNLVSISCGGFADWIFGWLRDRHVPLNLIFGVFAAVALLSVIIVLMIRPKPELMLEDSKSPH